jgi:hypothetical protein
MLASSLIADTPAAHRMRVASFTTMGVQSISRPSGPTPVFPSGVLKCSA